MNKQAFQCHMIKLFNLLGDHFSQSFQGIIPLNPHMELDFRWQGLNYFVIFTGNKITAQATRKTGIFFEHGAEGTHWN